MCKQQIYTAWKKWTEDFSSETPNEILFQIIKKTIILRSIYQKYYLPEFI